MLQLRIVLIRWRFNNNNNTGVHLSVFDTVILVAGQQDVYRYNNMPNKINRTSGAT